MKIIIVFFISSFGEWFFFFFFFFSRVDNSTNNSGTDIFKRNLKKYNLQKSGISSQIKSTSYIRMACNKSLEWASIFSYQVKKSLVEMGEIDAGTKLEQNPFSPIKFHIRWWHMARLNLVAWNATSISKPKQSDYTITFVNTSDASW